MYRATGKHYYYEHTRGRYYNWGQFSRAKTDNFSWDSKTLGTQLLLTQVTRDDLRIQFMQPLVGFCGGEYSKLFVLLLLLINSKRIKADSRPKACGGTVSGRRLGTVPILLICVSWLVSTRLTQPRKTLPVNKQSTFLAARAEVTSLATVTSGHKRHITELPAVLRATSPKNVAMTGKKCQATISQISTHSL